MKPFALDSLKEGNAGCPSDLALDRLAAGELAERGPVEAHLASCQTCAARWAVRTRGWSATPVDPRPLLAAVRRAESAPAPRRWWWWVAAAVPVVVAGVVAAVGASGPGTRHKGEGPPLALTVFRFEAGVARKVPSGTAFSAGDRLRFVVDLPSAGSVGILGVDSKRRLYVAWPRPGDDPSRPAGAQLELPGAVALDDSAGDETLFLVHCPGQRSAPSCTVSAAGALDCEARCTQVSFEVKRP